MSHDEINENLENANDALRQLRILTTSEYRRIEELVLHSTTAIVCALCYVADTIREARS